jgi:hypothetical protein
MIKLISKHELNPNAIRTRMSDDEYDQLIVDINQYLIENKEKGSTQIVFGNESLIVKHFPASFIKLFDSEAVYESTTKRFKKQLKNSDLSFVSYNSISTCGYFYHTFTISW